MANASSDRLATFVIALVSILIPLVVAVLLFLPENDFTGLDLSFIPLMNACINSTVSVLLVLGYVWIRRGNIARHKGAMLGAFVLSALFLISYVVYHSQGGGSTPYGGEGALRYVYYFILITHIVLATVIVPFVLFTLYRAFRGQFQRHKRIARWTFPLWLYVSVTGVLVYLMISPYYT